MSYVLIAGKQVRTKLSQAFNHWLKVPEDKLQVSRQSAFSLLCPTVGQILDFEHAGQVLCH